MDEPTAVLTLQELKRCSVHLAFAGLAFLPAPLLMLVSILAGVLAGMAVGSIPGIFKAKLNTSEAIVAVTFSGIYTVENQTP